MSTDNLAFEGADPIDQTTMVVRWVPAWLRTGAPSFSGVPVWGVCIAGDWGCSTLGAVEWERIKGRHRLRIDGRGAQAIEDALSEAMSQASESAARAGFTVVGSSAKAEAHPTGSKLFAWMVNVALVSDDSQGGPTMASARAGFFKGFSFPFQAGEGPPPSRREEMLRAIAPAKLAWAEREVLSASTRVPEAAGSASRI